MKKHLMIILLMVFCGSTQAQIVINELSPANNIVIQDEDGDSPDWIELYNTSPATVNLGGYRLSDDPQNPSKWVFPSGVYIPANGYITLFASDKNKSVFFDHWESLVNADGFWKYTVPLWEPDSNWRRLSGFNDALWYSGAGGIGYGDGDDLTILSAPMNSVFIRKVFNIMDTSLIASAVLHMDYDDAFVAYINGVEVARSNIGQNGVPVPYNALAHTEHEAKMYAGGDPEQYYLSEAFLKSFLVNGNNVLAIQVHNVTAGSSDLSALAWLSAGIKSSGTSYLPVPSWFALGASALHTNFKLSQGGESLLLSNSSGVVLSQITYAAMQPDHSCGLQPDGGGSQVLFAQPTPGASNNASASYAAYTSEPQFSLQGGFYPGSQMLTITSSTPGAGIRYTTDGSIPTAASDTYTQPIQVDSTVVITARTFHPSLLESSAVTNTYFINDSSSARLPVVSITVSPAEMFDPVNGIYTKGTGADPAIPFFGANFWQEREIRGHIEFYDKNRASCFEQDCGIEIYGNYSRSFPQKSMKIIARDGYGDGTFDYQLFPSKDIHSFRQFILRNAGTDWNQAHMRDALVHNLSINDTECDVMAYQPAVVYINGKYWGVYNIREKINKYYLNNNHGSDPDSVDLLQYNGLVMEGSNETFLQQGAFVVLNDMTQAQNFAVAGSAFDLKNLADYFAVETWSGNWDWLTNNVRYWREIRTGSRWRYILWDLDNGMGGSWSYVFNALDTNMHKPFDYTSLIFSSLTKNITYRHYFINRYADLLNTTFTPQNFNKILYSMRDSIDGEMPRHFERWGNGFNNPDWGIPGHGTYNDWRFYQMHELEAFAANRQITARNHIQETFGLKKQVPVTINVYPPGAGSILINTIIPGDLPWAGIYFDSVPVSITAIPKPGFQFAFWQADVIFGGPQSTPTLVFNPDTSGVFTAFFTGSPDTARIVFSEINYNSSVLEDAGDWVEFRNASAHPFDLSGWKFKDSQNSNSYVFPVNTVIPAGGFLVLCQDTTRFNAWHPNIGSLFGPFDFGLSSGGENLRLFDGSMNLCLSVLYSGQAPWPADANGSGRTLELLSVNGNPSDAANWFAGCPGGSPGGPFIPCNLDQDEPSATEDSYLKVYPNPASDHVIFEITGNHENHSISVVLFDGLGRPVYESGQVVTGKLEIRADFEPGLYYYAVLSSGGIIREGKLIILPR